MTLASRVPRRAREGLAVRTWLPNRPQLAFAAGLAATLAALLALGEVFLHQAPPRDFEAYLGDGSGLSGPFRPGGRFGVQYASWQAFHDDYAERLPAYLPLSGHADGRPVWAMFGNSFVQAPGMLADTARAAVPARRVFNLARNEVLPIRLAQIELLLSQGLRPERIFLVLLPIDALAFTQHSLDQLHVSAGGAITHRPRLPRGAAGRALAATRVGLLGWVRAGRHKALPGFRSAAILDGLPPSVEPDFRAMFGGLAELAGAHRVPVSVVIVPSYEQITRGVSQGCLDDLARLAREAGLGACDVREPFLRDGDKATLFIPDKHFSARGNQLLLQAILDHLARQGAGGRLTRS
jgi:hypothetical protein